jgi:hypothetical protein
LQTTETQKQQRTLRQNFNLDSVIFVPVYQKPPKRTKNNIRPQVLWCHLTPMKQPHLFAELACGMRDENVEFIMLEKRIQEHTFLKFLK